MSLPNLIEALLAAPDGRPFITMWTSEEDVQTVTFGEFIQLAKVQAAALDAHGLRYGDTVVLIMPQGIPLMIAFVGAMFLGAVPSILPYPNFKVEPVKYRAGLAGVSQNLRARLVVVDDAFPSELLDYLALAGEARLVRGLGTLVATRQPPLADVPLYSEDLAFIQHSAGTTGLQKGVALSHAGVLKQLSHLASGLNITHEDRIYSWLPLYHDMGLIACFMLPLVYHLHVVMQAPTEWVIQPDMMLRLISDYRCTLAWVPNFALQFVARRVRSTDKANYDLSSLRVLINCSEPVQAQSIDEFRAAYESCGLMPDALQSSYAMAENVFAVTQSGINGRRSPGRIWVERKRFIEEHTVRRVTEEADNSMCFVSSGQCLPGNEVRIVSPAGQDLPDGRAGEILIRSDSLFRGYYNRPDLTEKVLRGGWYWSGDLGFRLDGELYVVGRKKDLIIVAGKNIYPQDVEEIVCSHPDIHDGRAVAFGLYNPDLGTEDIVVVAEVEREDGLDNAFAIELALRNAIVRELDVTVRAIHLKPPRWIVKSTAGKPARSTTREKLLAEHPELLRR